MFLFTTLLITLVTIGVVLGLIAAIGVTSTLLVFGDLIVFGLLVAFIIKRLVAK